MTLHLLLLAAGLALLITGADLFVDGAARMARGLTVSPMAVGLTVVAFGSSAPELFTNIAAAISRDTDIALGNVVGSNIANILLILGVSSMIRPLHLAKGTVWKTIPFSLLAAVILWVVASDMTVDGCFFSAVSRSDGLVLVGYFTIFMAYVASIATPVIGLPTVPPVLPGRLGSVIIKILFGFCGLLFGGRMTTDSAVVLANSMGLPNAVMGLTVIAVGTSLPELATSIMAARRGESEIAVGNVVGSNVFNVFLVLAASAVIRPLTVDPKVHMDMGVMTAANILLVVFLFVGRERVMGRGEGSLSVLLYCLYVVYLFFGLYVR